MGYMGLDNWVESDEASDFIHGVIENMGKELDGHLSYKTNECNTDGVLNVAMFFEAFILPAKEEYVFFDELQSVATKATYILKSYIERIEEADWGGDRHWSGEDNKEYHLKRYKRMLKSLEEFLDAR